LFIVLAFSIYYKVQNQTSLQQTKDMLHGAVQGTNGWLIIALLLLMFLNWGLEAKKWQILVRRIQPVNFYMAYRAILSGLSLSLFLPNGLGDYAGRLVYMEEGKRLKSVTLTLVGSMAQLAVTLAAGLAGVMYLKANAWQHMQVLEGLSFFLINGIVIIIAIGTLILLFIYFKLSWLTLLVEKIPLVYKYKFMIENLESISSKDLTRILLLSATRFCVFVVQYLVMFHIFNVQLPIADAAATVCVLFLVLAILPTIPVADLGMRGEAGLQLFGILTVNKLGIVATTAGIWMLNLILPAVAGSLFMLGIKLFRNR
jgi:Lysylphosphatidylglycerol synthase TM region